MTRISKPGGYSIAAVSKLTGISCHAPRVWERRYGFPTPERSASGHRRYPTEQVGVLREIAALTQAGHLVGELIDGYRASGITTRPVAEGKAAGLAPSSVVLDLLSVGDLVGAQAVLDRFLARLSPLEMIERMIEPALVEVGERWFRQESSIYQDRCAVGCVFGQLNRLLDQVRRLNLNPGRRAVIGAVQGELHEGGVMMLSLALELAGWRAIPIGTDVPIVEFQKAVEVWKPDALALSFVLSRNINKRFSELASITSVPVFVGGRSIVNHQGLARRFGLIPLTGSLAVTSAELVAETDRWYGRCSRVRSHNNGAESIPPPCWNMMVNGIA